jgi:hypothetical protein
MDKSSLQCLNGFARFSLSALLLRPRSTTLCLVKPSPSRATAQHPRLRANTRGDTAASRPTTPREPRARGSAAGCPDSENKAAPRGTTARGVCDGCSEGRPCLGCERRRRGLPSQRSHPPHRPPPPSQHALIHSLTAHIHSPARTGGRHEWFARNLRVSHHGLAHDARRGRRRRRPRAPMGERLCRWTLVRLVRITVLPPVRCREGEGERRFDPRL